MINKRLLIKNLLTHNDENTFFDKKLKLTFGTKEGKAKFLKHVCALSNSNPQNNSYIVIGVEDTANKIVGVDFFDDSKIQNLINAYLQNPPKVQYENVGFPTLQKHKVVGLVTIEPNNLVTSFVKSAWKYRKGSIFYRRGSNSIPVYGNFELISRNEAIVESIEKSARSNIELTLNGVFDFFDKYKAGVKPKYKVFNEQFVLCWAGKRKKIENKVYYSRVDIELINEQVRLFFSALDDVQIQVNKNTFIITEYLVLPVGSIKKHFPFEKTIINFKNNGKHDLVTEFLFTPPKYDFEFVISRYQSSMNLIRKIDENIALITEEVDEVTELPHNCLICYLNGFVDIQEELLKVKHFLKSLEDKTTYIKFKEVMRVIRKVKYH
ncbi:MAG: AAA family ATPase [Flavobacteriaceae bacterium]|nr:AAA family ATPase [Flavobacteriaceae bacterium]|tara:strand:+ start:540739 stop:541878 length:1140 start_codon:yes stop_codon:yes gene_type:complete